MVRLVLDIGNTDLKAACFEGRRLLKATRCPLGDEQETEEMLLRLLALEPVSAFIGSVGGKRKEVETFLSRAAIPYIYADRTPKTPILNRYETPDTLGIDRLANAAAANALFPEIPVVVIDAGTCIKFDFVNKHNEYFGGSISPGIDMRFRALHHFTEKLPLLRRSDTVYLVGKNTAESIQSGVVNGAVAEVKGILEQYQMAHKDLRVIVTGGDHGLLERNLKTSLVAEPWLTLKGLNEIHLFDAE